MKRRLPLHWPLDDIMEVGAETGRRLWERSGVGAGRRGPTPGLRRVLTLRVLLDGILGLCPVGEAHRLVLEGGIDSDRPGSLPVLSGGGALGNGRMHGVPQMLECYLQLSGRAGERQRPRSVHWRGMSFLARTSAGRSSTAPNSFDTPPGAREVIGQWDRRARLLSRR